MDVTDDSGLTNAATAERVGEPAGAVGRGD